MDKNTTLSPYTLSGDLLLPQLIHGNKEKLTTVQEDETSSSNESITIEDPISLHNPPSELNLESEFEELEIVPLPQPTTIQGFSPFDLLKMAVVESNVDQQALERQARKHEQRKMLIARQARKQEQRKNFIEQENTNNGRRLSNINDPFLSEVSIAVTPSPVLTIKRVTSRVRSQHRFSPPVKTSASTSATPEMTEGTVTASTSSPSSNGKFLLTRRVQSRVRGTSLQSSLEAPTTTTATRPPTMRSRPRITIRRRLSNGRSRVRVAQKKKTADSSVRGQEQDKSKASEGIRNRSGVRSRRRIALRRRGPASRHGSSS